MTDFRALSKLLAHLIEPESTSILGMIGPCPKDTEASLKEIPLINLSIRKIMTAVI